MPSRIGRYAVRRRIGSGGFATVWLAYDEQLDAPVAVKVLADNWTEDHQVRTRFIEEGRYLRRVEPSGAGARSPNPPARNVSSCIARSEASGAVAGSGSTS